MRGEWGYITVSVRFIKGSTEQRGRSLLYYTSNILYNIINDYFYLLMHTTLLNRKQ